jgi:hypothetical protein
VSQAPVFVRETERLAAVEGAPADADADWLMDRAQACLAAGVPEGDGPLLTRAIYALARVGPWRRRAAVEWLCEVATGPFREAWGSAAIAAIVRHKADPGCAARMLEVAGNEQVGWGGRLLLAVSAGVAGVPLLAKLLPDTKWHAAALFRDVQAVLLAAPRAADTPLDPLALLNAEYERITWIQRVLALEALTSLEGVAEPARVVRWVAKIGKRGEPATRRAAAAALGRLGHEAGRAWLTQALGDRDAGVRRAARAALDRLPAAGDAGDDDVLVPGKATPLESVPRVGSTLESAPRRVPIAFAIDRGMRAGSAMTWIPWTLIAVGGTVQWFDPGNALGALPLVFGLLWHIVALPVSVVFAVGDVRFVRKAFVTLGWVGDAQQRVSSRMVRGSKVTTKWFDLPVKFLGDDGHSCQATVILDRAIDTITTQEVVLQQPGNPASVKVLRALDALRIDAHGRLRFGWSLRGTAAVGVVLTALVSCSALLVRWLTTS